MHLQGNVGKNKDGFIYLFLLAYAVLVMILCAGSSPLIRYLSPDSSIFYTMGRSAADGTVLYKEIADHKGFYLFFFNWVGAWLTPDSMNGLLFVEVCFAWVKLICVYQCAFSFYTGQEKERFSGNDVFGGGDEFLFMEYGKSGRTVCACLSFDQPVFYGALYGGKPAYGSDRGTSGAFYVYSRLMRLHCIVYTGESDRNVDSVWNRSGRYFVKGKVSY